MTDEIKKGFVNPGNEYRGAPFWAWNSLLDRTELLRQVDDMLAHGLGGGFMHSRVGLETPYMQEDFMECIEAVVKKSAEKGFMAYLYDEDRWPSGFAGGEVPRSGEGDAFRNKYLAMCEAEDAGKCEGRRLAEFAVVLNEHGVIKGLGEEGKSFVFTECVCRPSSWFNQDTYSDNLNAACVKKFIEVTYEKYRKRIGSFFGNVVPGIFTDEPNVLSHHGSIEKGVRILPWTTDLPKVFHERFGYSIIEKLPFLFFKGSESARVRHDFWKTISDMFVSAFTQQLGEWCERHGIALTGHMLCEGDLFNQIRVGGSVMPHYEFMQYPGIDIWEIPLALQDSGLFKDRQLTDGMALRIFKEIYRIIEKFGGTMVFNSHPNHIKAHKSFYMNVLDWIKEDGIETILAKDLVLSIA